MLTMFPIYLQRAAVYMIAVPRALIRMFTCVTHAQVATASMKTKRSVQVGLSMVITCDAIAMKLSVNVEHQTLSDIFQ